MGTTWMRWDTRWPKAIYKCPVCNIEITPIEENYKLHCPKCDKILNKKKHYIRTDFVEE